MSPCLFFSGTSRIWCRLITNNRPQPAAWISCDQVIRLMGRRLMFPCQQISYRWDLQADVQTSIQQLISTCHLQFVAVSLIEHNSCRKWDNLEWEQESFIKHLKFLLLFHVTPQNAQEQKGDIHKHVQAGKIRCTTRSITHPPLRPDNLIPSGVHQVTKVALCTTNQTKYVPVISAWKANLDPKEDIRKINAKHDYLHNWMFVNIYKAKCRTNDTHLSCLGKLFSGMFLQGWRGFNPQRELQKAASRTSFINYLLQQVEKPQGSFFGDFESFSSLKMCGESNWFCQTCDSQFKRS